MFLRTLRLFSILLLLSNLSFAQELSLTIIDKESGETIPFATVSIPSLNYHCVSNDSGTCIVPYRQSVGIKISCIGFETLYDSLDEQHLLIALSPSLTFMEELVVTAQFSPERADKSIYKVDVMTSAEIQRKAANDLADLLQSKPNLKLFNDANLGSSMMVQGLSGENIKIMIDGVPLTGRMNGNIDLRQINLDEVDHVEMISGPMSVIYGSNALAGVINIITSGPNKDKYQVYGTSFYESVGKYNLNLGGQISKGQHALKTNLGRDFFAGFDEQSIRDKAWKPKEQYKADLTYRYQKEKISINIKGNYFTELMKDKGTLQYEPDKVWAIDSDYFTTRYGLSTTINRKMRYARYLNINAAYNVFNRDSDEYYHNLSTLDKDLLGKGNYELNTFFLRSVYARSNDTTIINYQLGFDTNIDQGSGERIGASSQKIQDVAAFYSFKYTPTERYIFQPGIRLGYNSRYDVPLIYSLNMRYAFIKGLNSRFTYSKGFRSPGIKELYLDFVFSNHNISGNENLRAEYSSNMNLSVEYDFPKSRKGNHHVDIEFFRNKIEDMIALVRYDFTPGTNKYRYDNFEQFLSIGTQLSYLFAYKNRLNISLGYGRIGTYEQLANENQVEYLWSDDLTANLTYRFKRDPKLTFSTYYKYTGKLSQYYLNEDNEVKVGYVNNYHTWDMSLMRSFKEDNLIISLGLKNLFDNTDVISSGNINSVHPSGSNAMAVGWGRTIFVKLKYKIKGN